MPKNMLAVVKPQAKPGVEIRDVAIPQIWATDVLGKVKVASSCGTDLHIYNWDRWAQGRIHPPLIPGHEFCGEVAAIGDEQSLAVGEGKAGKAQRGVAGRRIGRLPVVIGAVRLCTQYRCLHVGGRG